MTAIDTLWVRLPLVPVTVTVPLRGVAVGVEELPPPPPQETAPIEMHSNNRPSRVFRNAALAPRLRFGFSVNPIPSAKTKLASIPIPRCENGNAGRRSMLRTAP